jgi:hypothetical protein
VFLHNDAVVWSEEEVQTVPLPGATQMILVGETRLFCKERQLDSDPHVECDIVHPKKLLCDPLNSSQFFVLSEPSDGPQQVSIARVRDGVVEHLPVRLNVDDFDVSRKFILTVLKGCAKLYARQDSAIAPLFEKQLPSNTRAFVDDEFFYEFLPKFQTLFVFADGKPVQQVKQVANVFKAGEIIIEYIDGTIAMVGRDPVTFEDPPIAAMAVGANLVTWTTLADEPSVQEVAAVEEPLVRRYKNLVEKLKAQLDGHRDEVIGKAEAIVAGFDKRLDTATTKVDKMIARVPDSAFFICLRQLQQGEVDAAFAAAAAASVECFEMLSDGKRLAIALEEEKLSQPTLIRAIAPLVQLLQKDVTIYAELAYDVLLSLESVPRETFPVLHSLQSVISELVAGNDTPAPSVTHKLKLTARIVTSLLAPA